MPGPTKPLVALAITALLLGSLSGCFLLPLGPAAPASSPSSSNDRSASDGDVVAETGDCWQTSYADLAEWASWEGDGSVDCDKRHQSYTYLAGDLEESIANGFDDGLMTNELALAVSDQCRAALEDEFGWSEKEQRLGFYFFVPTEQDWNVGDRAIRCDIALKALDSDFYDPDLENLPDVADLKRDLDSNSVAYQLCLIGDGFGPLEGSEATISDCTADEYLWRWGGVLDYPAASGESYPAGDTLYNYALDECPLLGIAQGETVYPYTPSPEAWAEGDYSIECWFSMVEVPSSAV